MVQGTRDMVKGRFTFNLTVNELRLLVEVVEVYPSPLPLLFSFKLFRQQFSVRCKIFRWFFIEND